VSSLLRPLEPFLLIWLGMVGACVGSFLNVVIFRLPRRCLSVFRPSRSFCPKCHHAIRWYENLPIVSWLLILRARCAGCGLPISARYPLVEAAVLVLFLALAYLDLVGRWHVPSAWGIYVVHVTFGCALLACGLIDWDLRVIPDAIDVPGIVLAPLAVCLFPALLGGRLPDVAGWAANLHLAMESPRAHPGLYPHLCGLVGGVLGAAVGGGFLWLFTTVVSRIVGREAIGWGDIKYLAMIGGLTGWQGVVLALFIASGLGALVGLGKLLVDAAQRKEGSAGLMSALPLGPFLSLGGAAAAFLPMFGLRRALGV
jgi:leader peptidase (prepilin peptidase)/N-methyltransferase